MKTLPIAVVCVASLASAPVVRADDGTDIVDKAIKAVGGEEKLGKGEGLTWKTKGVITFGGNDNNFTGETTAAGLNRVRSTFKGDFNGQEFEGVMVLDGAKGWRKFGDMLMDMDEEALANEKRNIYLRFVPIMLSPLKSKDFKVEAAGEEKVGDKNAKVVKITGPDGKDFRMWFDAESALPVKMVATVTGFQGEEYEQETTYADYTEFDGVKRPTKIESKRDGEPLLKETVSDYKVLDKVDAKTFAEPPSE